MTEEKVQELRLTPSQTVGPYLSLGLLREDWSELVSPDHPQAIRIEGTLYDGAGDPVTDGLVEIWQAAPSGRYDHPADDREDLPLEEGFHGFGRSGTVDEGRFSFVTLKPGPVPGPEGTTQAPHIMVAVFARGLLKQLITRIYFEDEAEANAEDPVLRSIADERLRETLIARKEGENRYRFDIRLQGEGQTAFFKLSE
ncbi:protocatechuate 3,4-dioxygenase subunit alpha [Rubrobacter xylanophilus]|uniref:Protocatechuate 3,4-dioxygenase subunit alpha n=1 Tax=Rubrobacter xylanophilus TaxID=49319 RepID=A0A510HKZ1_9ACTN|nr:protocatechuate 3,4-dioxygenase subunit alpha [Rubrobacter xylanophilus]BBL79027.1 protocatechuate 3,4-dioxygenase subunit alpha [Rubrobacter xylanophilus]